MSSSDDDGKEDRVTQRHINRLSKRPFALYVTKEKFRDVVFAAGYCEQIARIRSLAKVIAEQKRTRDPDEEGEDLVLGDIEDYALRFM